jgi:hypothetical protein
MRWIGKWGCAVRPTLAAEELKRNLTQYLSTTFALADQPVRDGLDRFLNHPDHGIFRGMRSVIATAPAPSLPLLCSEV